MNIKKISVLALVCGVLVSLSACNLTHFERENDENEVLKLEQFSWTLNTETSNKASPLWEEEIAGCEMLKLQPTESIAIDDIVQNCKKKKYALYLDPPFSQPLAKYHDGDWTINGMFLITHKDWALSIQKLHNTYVSKKGNLLKQRDCNHTWNEENASLPWEGFFPPLKLMLDITTFVNKRKNDIQGKINQLGVNRFATCPYNYYENTYHADAWKISRPYWWFLEKGEHYFLLWARNEALQYTHCPPKYFLIDGTLYVPWENELVDLGYWVYTKKGRWMFSDFVGDTAIVQRRTALSIFSWITIQHLENTLPIGEQYIETCEIPLR